MRNSCITYRAHSRKNVLHEDLLEICDGNMLAALILSDLIYWTDIKRAQHQQAITEAQATGKTADPLNLWIWKSHDDFQDDLMFDKAGMKKPHRTTIAGSIKLLQDKKFIERRRNPRLPLDRTWQYLFLQENTQQAVNALPSIVGKTTLESRESDNAPSQNQQSLSENRQCIDEKPTSNTIRLLTEITDSEITEESVCEPPTESPAHEDTHTSFSNSSSSEQGAEQSAPTPQARSRAEVATSAPAPRASSFPPSPHDARGDFPQDANRVGSPPADDKSQVNRNLVLHQRWARAYLKSGTTKELLLKALALREQWLAEYGTYGDTKWSDEALIWLAEQENGTWQNVQKVYALVPGETVTPEQVKNNWYRINGRKKPKDIPGSEKPSAQVSPEINQRNLERLRARVAAQQAAAGGKEG